MGMLVQDATAETDAIQADRPIECVGIAESAAPFLLNPLPLTQLLCLLSSASVGPGRHRGGRRVDVLLRRDGSGLEAGLPWIGWEACDIQLEARHQTHGGADGG